MREAGREKIVIIGALPPPFIGPTLATEVLLNSTLSESYVLIHLNTSDHRDIETLGALDFTNVWLGIRSYWTLLALLFRHRPDVVYIPISQTTVGYLRDSVYIWLAKLFRCKVVCHLRGGYFRHWVESASRPTRSYVRHVHAMVDAQIVLGDCLRSLFDGFVRDPGRIFVVPNGKDVERTLSREIESDRVCILYLANMIRTKGVLDVLAASRIIGTSRNVEFVFAGAWHEPELRREIEAFLQANPELPIKWHGPASGTEKQDLFDRADVFVFPTYYPPEGHPWVVVEAMAAGLPVIATDQGAVRESVVDGSSGFLVNKQDPKDLAARIVQLIDDPELRRSMGSEGRRRYLDQFTESKMIENLKQVFDAVTATSRGRSVSR